MNYTTQIDRFSCGPTAIYNAIIWSRPEYRPSRRKLFHLCECEPIFGTITKKLDKTLVNSCADPRNNMVLEKKSPTRSYWEGYEVTFKLIKNALLNGKIVLLDFHWDLDEDADEHYVILVDIKDAASDRNITVQVLNPDEPDAPGKVSIWYKSSQILEMLKFYEYSAGVKYSDPADDTFPKAWILNSKKWT